MSVKEINTTVTNEVSALLHSFGVVVFGLLAAYLVRRGRSFSNCGTFHHSISVSVIDSVLESVPTPLGLIVLYEHHIHHVVRLERR